MEERGNLPVVPESSPDALEDSSDITLEELQPERTQLEFEIAEKKPNLELVKKAYNIYRNKYNVTFKHIMAHTGKQDRHSIGNDGADS